MENILWGVTCTLGSMK